MDHASWVPCMQAMYFEAKGKLKEAEDHVAKMLADHPDSHYALKRQVGSNHALHKL